ncbi:hypothetical protein ABZ622_34185 [Streptomyces sp. NPDC007164]|uniref:hypothetical protein n=1 Tax=Streptomyces sp. NPDC007164 TaxID=3156918 RepID=UPI0033F23B1C
MGFYDFRCAVTGISLRGTDAVLVGLRPVGDRYRPLTLGIVGEYNRLGSIDRIAEDPHTDLVAEYFHRRARAGDFVMDPGYADNYGNPPRDIECLLAYFERNVSDSSEEHPAATLFGRRVFSTLVARPVWTALASAFAPGGGTCETWYQEIFAESPEAGEMYRGLTGELARHIEELSAVDGFLDSRGLAWPIPCDDIGGQHFGPEIREYLDAARSDFRDVPAVLEALTDYEQRVGDLLDD